MERKQTPAAKVKVATWPPCRLHGDALPTALTTPRYDVLCQRSRQSCRERPERRRRHGSAGGEWAG